MEKHGRGGVDTIKLRRGRVITPSHGEIDFCRDDISMETSKELYDRGFSYLELTDKGKKELYGIEDKPLFLKQQITHKKKKL